MDLYFIQPLLVLLAFAMAIGEAWLIYWGLCRMGGRWKQAVVPSEKKTSIEGLRGVLAFAVVIHHGFLWYRFSNAGFWGAGSSIVFGRLADFGVLQFFYISGYLFWRKLMRRGRVPLGQFYLSRFIRIGPVFYACVGMAFVIGLMVHGFYLQGGIGRLLGSTASWIAFSQAGMLKVGGVDIELITAGVAWTLALEWDFYLLLPFLGWFARKAHRLIWLALIFGTILFVSREFSVVHTAPQGWGEIARGVHYVTRYLILGFGGGILVAVLEPTLVRVIKLSPKMASGLLLGCYCAYLLVPGIVPLGNVLLLVGFALVVMGADLFGMITSPGVRMLGLISYDLYVVHGIVYYVAMRSWGGAHLVTANRYIPEAMLCMTAAVLLSVLLHFFVERPTMLISERIARRQAGDGRKSKLVTV